MNFDEIEKFPSQAEVQASYDLHCQHCHIESYDTTLVATDVQGAVVLQAKRPKKEVSVWIQYSVQFLVMAGLLGSGYYQYTSLTKRQKEQKEKAQKRQ